MLHIPGFEGHILFCTTCLVDDAGLKRITPAMGARGEQCARCQGIFPLGQMFRHDPEQTELFIELTFDEVTRSTERAPTGRPRILVDVVADDFSEALALSPKGVVSAGSGFPLYPPRLPCRRRIYFAGDINLGIGIKPNPHSVRNYEASGQAPNGVFTTSGIGRHFGPRAVVRVDRIRKRYPRIRKRYPAAEPGRG